MKCNRIAAEYEDEIEEVIESQIEDNREAIFFIYEDGTTTDVFKGEPTQISLSREQEAHIMSKGKVVGSVHSHPTGFDPSTIDIMTGVLTRQESMCVAVPIQDESIGEDFVLSCLDLSNLTFTDRRRLIRAMRRSSVGLAEISRQARKQMALQRFRVDGCRTHKVEIEGIDYPKSDRPSLFELNIGDEVEIEQTTGDSEFID